MQSMMNFLRDPTGDLPWEEDADAGDVVHIEQTQVNHGFPGGVGTGQIRQWEGILKIVWKVREIGLVSEKEMLAVSYFT